MKVSMVNKNVLLSTRCRRVAKFVPRLLYCHGQNTPTTITTKGQWAQTRSERLENRTANLPDRNPDTVPVRSSSLLLTWHKPWMSVEHLGTYPVSKISYWQKCAYTFFTFMSNYLSNHPLIRPSIQPSIQPIVHPSFSNKLFLPKVETVFNYFSSISK
jgi:hypothetical protein